MKKFKIRYIKYEKNVWFDDSIVTTFVQATSDSEAIEKIKNTPGFREIKSIEEV